MDKVLIFFINLLILSCSKKNEESNTVSSKDSFSFVKNDTIKDILNTVIKENERFGQLQISLLDLDEITIMKVQIDDVLNSCDGVKGVFKLNDINIIIKDFSKNHDFDFLFDTTNSNRINVCDSLLDEFVGPHDPITYNFRLWENGYITYPNGDSLIYSSEGIKLSYWK